MNTTTQTTITRYLATSAYGRVLRVTVSAKGLIHTESGALLGDVEGMERLGWEIAPAATETTEHYCICDHCRDAGTCFGCTSGHCP